ncbi:hypothetical protein GLYMA_06G209800v4 [Glycine max]|nr:hypothetical protein GLYMA_06G209800v4 [Glycine max]
MIIKVSFIVAASIAALKISQTKTSSSTKRNGSDGSHLEQEFEERENSTVNANHVIQNEEKEIKFEMPQNLPTGEFKDLELLIDSEKMHNATKKEVLQNLVQNYKQREVNLERKLLKLNSLREEQSAIAQMQKQLEEKTETVEILKKTIGSLQSESEVFREKIREDLMLKKQLDIAKKMMNEMHRKKDVNASPVREQILMLQQQVAEFRKFNSSGGNAMGNKKLKDVQDMMVKVLELKRRNKELELEKRELVIKLATAQARIRTEEEIGPRIKQEITGLRHVHEELSEQVERLQRNRFDMVQEVVYQRWLYTLLKFEVHDHQKQSRKASRRDSIRSQNSSKELCGKKHASISDLELESVSSNSTSNENDEIETNTFESSSSSQSSSGSTKLKRWRTTKDYSNKIWSKGRNFFIQPGPIQRFSMSMVESDVSKLESPITPKIKRVSFSDSVKLSTYEDMPETTTEDAIDDKGTKSEQIMELTSSVVNSINIDCIEKNEGAKNKIGHLGEVYSSVVSSTNIDSIEKNEGSKNKIGHSGEVYSSGVSSTNIDSIEKNEGAKNKIGHSDEVYSRNGTISRKDDRIKTILVQLVTFLFFLLILLACFRIK